MKRLFLLTLLSAFLSNGGLSIDVHAQGRPSNVLREARRKCNLDVAIERRTCAKTCLANSRLRQRGCSSTDPACAQQCNDQREKCLSPLEASFDQCKTACNTPFNEEKARCTDTCKTSTSKKASKECYNSCIAEEVGTNATCRFNCRSSFSQDDGVKDAKALCTSDYGTCVKACASPIAVPTIIVSPTASPTATVTPTP